MNPSPPSLDLEQLVAPLSEESPAGDENAYAYRLRERFSELRREEFPEDFDDLTRPAELKKADWKGTVELALETLLGVSKDLRVACHLVEGLTHLYGLEGFLSGLTVLERVVEQCWDRSYPALEDDNPEARIIPLANMLDDPDRGACFPNAIRAIPLVGRGEDAIGMLEWSRLKNSDTKEDRERLRRALAETPAGELARQAELAQECLEKTKALAKVLDEKLGPDAPGLLNVADALADCLRLIESERPAAAPAASEPEESRGDAGANGAERAEAGPIASLETAVRGTAEAREEIYRQLAHLAGLLEQIETHSPAPYLVRRAVELGRMSFPGLMQDVIREEDLRAELERRFSMTVCTPAASEGGGAGGRA